MCQVLLKYLQMELSTPFFQLSMPSNDDLQPSSLLLNPSLKTPDSSLVKGDFCKPLETAVMHSDILHHHHHSHQQDVNMGASRPLIFSSPNHFLDSQTSSLLMRGSSSGIRSSMIDNTSLVSSYSYPLNDITIDPKNFQVRPSALISSGQQDVKTQQVKFHQIE